MLRNDGAGSSAWPGLDNETDNISNNDTTEVGPNDQGAPGTVFCFAYALPYTYSDLMSDLENSKRFLLKNGGIVVNQKQEKAAATKLKKKEIF